MLKTIKIRLIEQIDESGIKFYIIENQDKWPIKTFLGDEYELALQYFNSFTVKKERILEETWL